MKLDKISDYIPIALAAGGGMLVGSEVSVTEIDWSALSENVAAIVGALMGIAAIIYKLYSDKNSNPPPPVA